MDEFVIRTSQVQRIRKVEGGVLYSISGRPSLTALDLWLEQHTFAGTLVFHGGFSLVHKFLAPWRVPTDKMAPNKELLELGLQEIKRVHDATNQKAIKLIVMPIASFDTDNFAYPHHVSTNSAVKEWCAAQGIMTLDPTNALEASTTPLRLNAEDYHWSASANAIVGQKLASLVVFQNLIPAHRGSHRRLALREI